MERLTKRNSDGTVGISELRYYNYNDFQKMAQKLAEYEDLEEQGMLLRLPIEAYFIKNNKMYKGWVQELVYSPCRKLLLDIRYDDNTLDSYRGYVGNTVFLTQSKAEQKLKEMNGNNGITE